jgi:FkbM family methyltransferase
MFSRLCVHKSKESLRRLFTRRQAKHIILSGPLRGLPIYTSWHDYPGAILGTTERKLLRWFQTNVRPGETWLDIGAHYGYTAIALSRLVGPAGRVFAFEPVPATVNSLDLTRDANSLVQLTVLPLALNDQPRLCALRLPLVRGMADSTLIHAQASETVEAVSLDAYWGQLAGSNPQIHGIKMDVQGMELQALRGMRGLLVAWTPKLIVEFHSGVSRGSVIDLLASAGYSTSYRAVDGAKPSAELADNRSYIFEPKPSRCAF